MQPTNLQSEYYKEITRKFSKYKFFKVETSARKVNCLFNYFLVGILFAFRNAVFLTISFRFIVAGKWAMSTTEHYCGSIKLTQSSLVV